MFLTTSYLSGRTWRERGVIKQFTDRDVVVYWNSLADKKPLILRGLTLKWAEKDHKTVHYLCLPFQSLKADTPDSLLYYAMIEEGI